MSRSILGRAMMVLAVVAGSAIGLGGGSTASAATTSYYASPLGSGYTCSQAAPCSVHQVLLHVREKLKTTTGAIDVLLKDGTYRLPAPLTFLPADSGRNGYQVTWKPEAGATPVLSGGVDIPNWTVDTADTRLWSAAAPPSLRTRHLYADGRRLPRARGNYPADFNGTTLTRKDTAGDQTGYTASNSSLSSWRNHENIEFVFPNTRGGWAEPRCPVASISGTDVRMRQPCWDNQLVQGGPTGNFRPMYPGTVPAVVENAYELLSPGEWYLDEGANRVYYYPKPGDSVGAMKFVAPAQEQLVTSTSTATDPLHDVTFQGITFADTTWLQPSGNDGFSEMQANMTITGWDGAARHGLCDRISPVGSCPFAAWSRPLAAVDLTGTRNVSFLSNTFTRLGGAGLGLYHGADSNLIRGNEFMDISSSGIQLGSTDDPLPTYFGRTNLARGRSATQSSTYGSAVAGRAVDGVTNPLYGGGSVTHTNKNDRAWWQVDLGADHELSSINIYNRMDSCCPQRLSDYYVFVSNTPLDPSTPVKDLVNTRGVWSRHYSTQAGSPTVIPAKTTGRYVMIQLAGEEYLSLAEVEVMDGPTSPETNYALGMPASQSSTASGGVPSRAVDGNTSGMDSVTHSVSHTNSQARAWWKVDLGQVRNFSSIKIFNRTDCCHSRLSDYYVYVSNSALDPTRSVADLTAASVWSRRVTSHTLSIPTNTSGRHVLIQLAGTGFLSLAEVQVVTGEDPSAIVTNNTIDNNYVHNVGVDYTAAIGINVGYSRYTKVTHNQVSDLPYSGINMGWGGWHTDAGSLDYNPNINGGSEISYNLITNVMGTRTDGGSIYTNGPLGTSYEFGLTMKGNVTYGNKHTNFAYYNDEGGRWVTNEGNVQYDDPGHFNGGCSTSGQVTVRNEYYIKDLHHYGACGGHGGPEAFPDLGGHTRVEQNPAYGIIPDTILATAGLEGVYRSLTTRNPPSVRLVSPPSNGKLLVSGIGFSDATAATIGGVPSPVTVLSSNYLVVTFPAGAGSGNLVVTTAAGSSQPFFVHDPASNLANGKIASQSSNYTAATVAGKAIDGNLDGNSSHGSVSITGSQARPWWQVDLEAAKWISAIDVYNRTDGWGERLSNYWVFVSTQPFNTSLTPTAQSTAPGVVFARRETAQAGSPTTIPVARNGQYVMVQLEGSTHLQLAEVVVND